MKASNRLVLVAFAALLKVATASDFIAPYGMDTNQKYESDTASIDYIGLDPTMTVDYQQTGLDISAPTDSFEVGAMPSEEAPEPFLMDTMKQEAYDVLPRKKCRDQYVPQYMVTTEPYPQTPYTTGYDIYETSGSDAYVTQVDYAVVTTSEIPSYEYDAVTTDSSLETPLYNMAFTEEPKYENSIVIETPDLVEYQHEYDVVTTDSSPETPEATSYDLAFTEEPKYDYAVSTETPSTLDYEYDMVTADSASETETTPDDNNDIESSPDSDSYDISTSNGIAKSCVGILTLFGAIGSLL